MIQERFTLKPKISSVNEANFAALNQVLQYRTSKLLRRCFLVIEDIVVKNGKLILTIPEEFEVHLTVLGERKSIQWTLLNINMFVKRSLWSQTRAFFAAVYATQVLQSRTDIAKNIALRVKTLYQRCGIIRLHRILDNKTIEQGAFRMIVFCRKQ
ncbi:unnamed protein product [Cylicocyclus nassatus]|uniref:Uncharacterized protein n=1 Tax=Cylicocyclus nassatus TaxID=53992 RepID=A0AA36H925_CYLNA|nr:unnamed protein product [Cylicocyclus nassatus]